MWFLSDCVFPQADPADAIEMLPSPGGTLPLDVTKESPLRAATASIGTVMPAAPPATPISDSTCRAKLMAALQVLRCVKCLTRCLPVSPLCSRRRRASHAPSAYEVRCI